MTQKNPGELPPIYSHSMLNTFETCPRMFDAANVTADYPPVWGDKTPEQQAGIVKHKAFENSLLLDAPMAPEYRDDVLLMHAFNRIKAIKKALGAKSNLIPEHQLAISSDGNEVDFKADNAWFRGILDVAIEGASGQVGYIGDIKNGKSAWSTPDQLDRCALLMFKSSYTLKKIIAEYHYISEGKKFKYIYYKNKKLQDTDKKTVSKTETQLQDKLVYDIQLIESCHEKGNWVAKRNGLCKNHCSVLNCKFNGKYKK